MKRQYFRAIWRLARALLFYPLAIGAMIWLILTGQHWGWGVLILVLVLVLDPIYRVMAGTILRWRPHPRDKDEH